jgi:hypothetical protein
MIKSNILCAKIFFWLVSLSIGITTLIGAPRMNPDISDFSQILPEDIEDWESFEAGLYDQNNLYDYIDGGAELYLSYGFQRLLSRKYTKAGQPHIILDIFDMGNSWNAFGIFSHSREEEDNVFGQGSQSGAGFLMFWKDKYYISILASPETEDSKNVIVRLAELIDNAIPEEGPLPTIISSLPEKSLIGKSIKYFKHHVWLNTYYFVADQNVFHIGEETEAVLAKYQYPDYQAILLLVSYPDETQALKAYKSFFQYILPDKSVKSVVQLEDGKWAACRQEKHFLRAVFNAQSTEDALYLIKSAKFK